ncbi:MAG: lysophospholipid acyltransferase family protein [Luteolibacter sp.]
MSKKEKDSEIRIDRKSILLGAAIGWIMKLWSWTLRYDVTDHAGITRRGSFPQPVILALWHNRIFAVPPIWYRCIGKFRPCVVLTSASHDGTILSRAMAVFGLGAVRGSSSRRAVAALIAMKRALKEGNDICITPDGPRGPRYEFQPGIVKIAESSGSPLIPMHARFHSAWRLKTWDRFVIPKPFSRVDFSFGEPLYVAPCADDPAFEAERKRIEDTLRAGADDVSLF